MGLSPLAPQLLSLYESDMLSSATFLRDFPFPLPFPFPFPLPLLLLLPLAEGLDCFCAEDGCTQHVGAMRATEVNVTFVSCDLSRELVLPPPVGPCFFAS